MYCNYIFYITKLNNSIFKLCYFFKSWKTAIISPIPKPSCNLNDPSKLHPISLFFCLSKIIERFIRYQLNEFLQEDNIPASAFQLQSQALDTASTSTCCEIPLRKRQCEKFYCCYIFRHRFWQWHDGQIFFNIFILSLLIFTLATYFSINFNSYLYEIKNFFIVIFSEILVFSEIVAFASEVPPSYFRFGYLHSQSV